VVSASKFGAVSLICSGMAHPFVMGIFASLAQRSEDR
jgi:hypothetical protein